MDRMKQINIPLCIVAQWDGLHKTNFYAEVTFCEMTS